MTTAVWPPAILNAPLASVKIAPLRFLARSSPAALATTAARVLSVIVPLQLVSTTGQFTSTLTVPAAVAVRAVPAISTSGTADGFCSGRGEIA